MLTGVECEYAVHRDGELTDFAEVLPDLVELAQRVATPLRRESARRYRLAGGHLLMADGGYAEVATPPEALGPMTPSDLATSSLLGRNVLLGLLGALSETSGHAHALRGYSTHLNIECPPVIDGGILARRYAASFGPLMMLLTSLPPVLGVIARSRRGRFELITDCLVEPDLLRGAVTAFIGSFFATYDAEVHGRRLAVAELTSESLMPATQRNGWRVNFELRDPPAFKSIRRRWLPVKRGVRTQVQELAESSWQAALPQAGRWPASMDQIWRKLEDRHGSELPMSDHIDRSDFRRQQDRPVAQTGNVLDANVTGEVSLASIAQNVVGSTPRSPA